MLVPIAFSMKDYGGDASFDLASTLRAGNHATSHANGGQPPAIAFAADDYKNGTFSAVDVSGALTTSADRTRAAPIVCEGNTNSSSTPGLGAMHAQDFCYAIQAGALRTNPNSGPDGVGVQAHIAYTLEARAEVQAVCITGEVTHTLKAEGFDASEDGSGRGQPIAAAPLPIGLDEEQNAMVDAFGCLKARSKGGGFEGSVMQSDMAVRRLTPRECERLQSFPDFHTLIPMKIVTASRAETMLVKGDPVMEIAGVWWALSADGPRYKALGNSMCVFNMRWIGRRVHFALTGAWPACANFMHEREVGWVAA